MPRLLFLAVAALAFYLTAVPAHAQSDYSTEQLQADLKLLEDAKVPHGDADLLSFFKSRLLSDQERARINGIIKKMASPKFAERDKAVRDVEQEGPRALPLLRKVLQSNPELELKMRAEGCIKAIEKASPNAHILAAARILKHRRVDGSAALLMEYLPLAPNDTVEEELFASIYGLALAGAKLEVLPPTVRTGKLDSVLVAALADKEPARRAIAALVVGHYGDANQRKGVAKLLTDAEPKVRLRAAQGLASARDASGVPVLVELVGNGPMNVAVIAEDLLGLVAQDKRPAISLGETKEQRKKAHAAWQDWWDKNKNGLDLSKIAAELPFGSMESQANKAVMQFINALIKWDVPGMSKWIDTPFSLGGEMTFSTRQEFEDFFQKNAAPPPQRELKVKVVKTVSGTEFVKNAGERDRKFLQTTRLAQVYVIFVEGQESGRPSETIPFFMRVSGGQARCIGVGDPRDKGR